MKLLSVFSIKPFFIGRLGGLWLALLVAFFAFWAATVPQTPQSVRPATVLPERLETEPPAQSVLNSPPPAPASIAPSPARPPAPTFAQPPHKLKKERKPLSPKTRFWIIMGGLMALLVVWAICLPLFLGMPLGVVVLLRALAAVLATLIATLLLAFFLSLPMILPLERRPKMKKGVKALLIILLVLAILAAIFFSTALSFWIVGSPLTWLGLTKAAFGLTLPALLVLFLYYMFATIFTGGKMKRPLKPGESNA